MLKLSYPENFNPEIIVHKDSNISHSILSFIFNLHNFYSYTEDPLDWLVVCAEKRFVFWKILNFVSCYFILKDMKKLKSIDSLPF